MKEQSFRHHFKYFSFYILVPLSFHSAALAYFYNIQTIYVCFINVRFYAVKNVFLETK